PFIFPAHARTNTPTHSLHDALPISCSNQNLQVLTLHLTAERGKTTNVRDQKPARNILDFAQCSLQQVHFGLPRTGDWLPERQNLDRKSTRLNSSHLGISYAVFCLKK